MRTTIGHFGVLAGLLASAILPAAAAAQQPAPAPRPAHEARTPDATHAPAAAVAAERVQARALQPNTSAQDWVETANALVGAARLRPAGDVRAVDDLIGAAGAYRIAGKLTAARRTAVEAARQALRLHDADRAAHAYLAAGSLSFELREEGAAQDYLGRAATLSASPGLSAEQKRTIVALLRETRSEGPKD